MNTLNLSGLPYCTRLTLSDDQFLHTHDFYECFQINEGAIYHEIDGKKYLLETGDAVIVAPDCPHAFKRINGQSCIHRDNMIAPELFEECCNLIGLDIIEKLKKQHFIQYKISKSSIESFEESTSSYIKLSDVEKMRQYNYCLVIALLSRMIISDDRESYSNNKFMHKCDMILTSCFSHFNAIDEVYDQLGYNKSYVSKKFKDNYGTTLTEKINELKIKYSAYLLSVTNYTIPEICDKVGIESIPYFHKLFKKYYGTTPYGRKSKSQGDNVKR